VREEDKRHGIEGIKINSKLFLFKKAGKSDFSDLPVSKFFTFHSYPFSRLEKKYFRGEKRKK